MIWPLILTLGSFTLIVGIFVGFIVWANWDQLFDDLSSQNDSK